MAAGIFALISCDDKKDKDSLILHIPSPGGSEMIIKNYSLRSGSYIMKLLDASASNETNARTIVTEAPRNSRNGQEDGVVVGWTGEDRVTIGWPIGDTIPPGLPASPFGIKTSYINYDPDLANTTPFLRDYVTLENISYATEPRVDDVSGNCVIRIKGTDNKFFHEVEVRLVRLTYMLSATGKKQYLEGPNHVEFINFALEFTATPLADGGSPRLTVTQAKMAEIGPFAANTSRHRISLLQNRATLIYSGFDRQDHAKALRLFRDGSYMIRLNLTFGSRQIEYAIRKPIDPEIVDSYQSCVSQR